MRLFESEWEPDNDTWFTPPFIFEALDLEFDLDPATPPGGVPWIPARKIYTEFDDGLLQPWQGLVWLNPPYSNPAPWIETLYHHGHGVALLPGDTSTGWFHRWVATADALCFIKDRLRFVREDRGLETSARFPSVLVGYGAEAAEAVAGCQLGWVVDQR